MSKVGCHVSIAGGVFNAPKNGADLGCEVIQIFTRSPQGGSVPPLTPEIIKKFKEEIKKNKISNVYVHAPYFINFASSNNRIRYGSISTIREELERASLLGAKYVMTHLGSAKDLGVEESIKKTVEGLKKVFDGYNGSAKLLIENSAGSGSIIGSDFTQIEKIIKAVKNKNLAGICMDTQHGFASGYNWQKDFPKNVKLIHANDSASELGSRVDRHAHIGQGKIGLDTFKKIVAFAKKQKVDLICETEHDRVKEDMEILRRLVSG